MLKVIKVLQIQTDFKKDLYSIEIPQVHHARRTDRTPPSTWIAGLRFLDLFCKEQKDLFTACSMIFSSSPYLIQ